MAETSFIDVESSGRLCEDQLTSAMESESSEASRCISIQNSQVKDGKLGHMQWVSSLKLGFETLLSYLCQISVLAIGMFFLSCWDVFSDVALGYNYLNGTTYVKLVQSHSDPAIQPKDLEIFVINFGVQHNNCSWVNTTEAGEFEYECFEQDLIYGILTILCIISPGHMLIGVIYGRATASLLLPVVSFRGGCYILVVGLVIMFLFVILAVYWMDIAGVIDLFMLAYGLFCSLISNAPCGTSTHLFHHSGVFIRNVIEYFVVILIFLIIGMISALVARNGAVRRECGGAVKINFWHIFSYPFILLGSPIIIVFMKFRFIFPIEDKMRKKKIILSLSESIMEATPQTCLQLYILWTNFDRAPSAIQWISIVSGTLALSVPPIEKYLSENCEEVKILNILILFPLFFCATIFKVLSFSVLLVFLSLWTMVIFALTLMLSFCILWNEQLKYEPDYNQQRTEALGQSFIRLTNMENTKAARHFRRCSIILHMVLYSVWLLAIVTICNLCPEITGWSSLPIVMNIWYTNGLVISIIGVAVLSVLLDVVYGVFMFDEECWSCCRCCCRCCCGFLLVIVGLFFLYPTIKKKLEN